MKIYEDNKKAELIRAYFDGKLEVFEQLPDGRWYAWKAMQTMSEEAIIMMKPERYKVEKWMN